MDQRRFDSLARSLAAPKSRRGLLGSLAALCAGLLGARRTDAQVTQATCGNKFCAANPGVCTNGCVCCAYPNGNSRCRPPGQCAPGEVRCPSGQVLGPSGVCVAPTTTTVAPCPSGLTRCGEACVDTVTAPTNCGACGTRCPVNETCVNGRCNCAGFGGSAAPSTCCPSGDLALCEMGTNNFAVADTCERVSACPSGYTPCFGNTPEPDETEPCNACCPPGTACDSLFGVCRQ